MSAHSIHRMPFGAQFAMDGARFRLWAPAAQRVELLFYDSTPPRVLNMTALPDGWFELITVSARAGVGYRYRIDGKLEVPDPASRCNSTDVQGPSVLVDPTAYAWCDGQWRGRPWHEAVIYELHVGTFTAEGTFRGVLGKLDHLVQLGVTLIELMPLAEFPGERGWGYDGVLPYAPESAYGTPDDLKALIDAAHARGLGVLLDVVYNHFGPQGNYLHAYAPQFFSERHQTPWGAAINFDGAHSRNVRDFFIHNVLYWLEEYHFDGLRFDAVHAIHDDSRTHILTEIACAVRGSPANRRHIHLVLENALNQASHLGEPGSPERFEAQWNDDLHHCLHVILTGETDGYYVDYAGHANQLLCRALTEGFAYQGEHSEHEGTARGEASAQLPATAFVSFLQNHDQIGNRAFGERLAHLVADEAALLAATAVLLLAPAPVLLFMGEEWAAPEPFVYFCDFEPGLAEKVREGRRREFARFEKFSGQAGNALPDPTARKTFLSARLDWSNLARPPHAQWLERYRCMLAIRLTEVMPRIPHIRSRSRLSLSEDAFCVQWQIAGGAVLRLVSNLSARPASIAERPQGRVLFTTHPDASITDSPAVLAPWSVTWLLQDFSRADA